MRRELATVDLISDARQETWIFLHRPLGALISRPGFSSERLSSTMMSAFSTSSVIRGCEMQRNYCLSKPDLSDLGPERDDFIFTNQPIHANACPLWKTP